MIKKILWILLVLLIGIQFFRPDRNIAASPSGNHISTIYGVPEEVNAILKRSCYDCHSNNTTYPWYANVQPVAWWLNNHIEDGKGEVNFDEFATYRPARQYRKLKEIHDEVDEGEMPLSSYTLIHTNAKLSDSDKKTILEWLASVKVTMESKYPADSLKLKKK